MMIETVRKVTQAEYLRELEQKYGPIEKLRKAAKKDFFKEGMLEQWEHMLAHPERNEQSITQTRALIFPDVQAFLALLNRQRLEILGHLKDHPEVESLNRLAKDLDRDYRNVHSDIQKLASAGMVRLEERANRIVPHLAIEKFSVTV